MRKVMVGLALAFVLGAAPVAAQRSPGGAGVLSALVVGAGQAYNGEWEKALAFVGTGAVLFNVYDGSEDNVVLASIAGLYVANIVDAVRSAKRLNREAVAVAPLIGPGRFGLAVTVR